MNMPTRRVQIGQWQQQPSLLLVVFADVWRTQGHILLQ